MAGGPRPAERAASGPPTWSDAAGVGEGAELVVRSSARALRGEADRARSPGIHDRRWAKRRNTPFRPRFARREGFSYILVWCAGFRPRSERGRIEQIRGAVGRLQPGPSGE